MNNARYRVLQEAIDQKARYEHQLELAAKPLMAAAEEAQARLQQVRDERDCLHDEMDGLPFDSYVERAKLQARLKEVIQKVHVIRIECLEKQATMLKGPQ